MKVKSSNLIPKNKEDVDFIKNLNLKSIKEIKGIIPKLLEWMQDINWTQTGLLFDYFSPYINEIDNEIVDILKGNDGLWKYSILLGLILNPSADIMPNDRILYAVQKLYENATEDDIESGNIELAEEILEKYKFNQ